MSSISTVRGGPRGIVTDGLVLWLDASYPQSYPGNGTTWYDLTSNNNNGTLTNGPTYSSANGGSIQFDGVDDYVDCGNQASINLISSITVSAWIKTEYTANIYRGIVDKGRDNFGAWSLNVDETSGGGQNQSTFKIKISGVNRYVTSVSKYSNNAWTQIVGTFDGTFLSIYQNEKLENSLNYPGTIGVNSISVKIGSTNDGYALNGNIGFVSIYNRALSAQEILQNYNATKTRFGL